jgi:F-type H+-transporting ATPase subunit epsilon
MAEQFQLRVVTPRASVLDAAVEEATGPGTIGEFGVLPNHAAFLTTLEIGSVTYKLGGRLGRIAVRGGFAEVVDNVMTVLVDAAQPAEEIDRVAAEADLKDALARLEDLSPLAPAFAEADADRRWAETRIEVAKRK